MSKNLGVKPYLFPMPTYMIGTYNEDDTVDVMMMAWGGICAEDMVALNLEAEHKTVANLDTRKAFTLAVPSTDTLRESQTKWRTNSSAQDFTLLKVSVWMRPLLQNIRSHWSVRLWRCSPSPMV